MADRYWVDDAADGDWEGTNNWATSSGGAGGAATPTSSDDVFLDGNGTTNCTMSAASACLSIDFATAYTGRLANGANTVDIGIGGMDLHDSTGGMDLGAGKWTCDGKWLVNYHQASFTRDSASLVELTGTATVRATVNERFNNLTVSGTYVSDGNISTAGSLIISGSLTANSNIFVYGTSVDITGGTFTGIGHFALMQNATITLGGSEWDIADTTFRRNIILNPGTYNGNILFEAQNGSRTLTFNVGTYLFTGPVKFDSDTADRTYTVNMNSNDPTVTFEDDVTLDESFGTLIFNAGSNAITFDGTIIYNDNGTDENLGDVDISSTADVQLVSDMTCNALTTQSGGNLDANGNTLHCIDDCDWAAGFTLSDLSGSTVVIDGNFTCDGQTLSATSTWDLQVTGSAVASGTGDVEYSDASGFTEITASAGPWTDSGDNVNWDFGAVAIVASPYYYETLMAGAS